MKCPKALHIVSVLYQGEKFEGNGCRKLCRSAHMLLDAKLMGISSSLPLVPYVSTFQAFDKLIGACYGSHPVEADIPNLLDAFSKAYLSLDISVTLKVHVLIGHLVPCLLNLEGQGLGIFLPKVGNPYTRYLRSSFG